MTLQSPYKSPIAGARRFTDLSPRFRREDDFESSPVAPPPASPFVSASVTQPLRTPVKQYHRASIRSALAVKNTNTRPPAPLFIPAQLGTKRKSTSTPVRSHPLTPLTIPTTDTRNTQSLAPIPAPRFVPSQAEVNRRLRTQTDTMTHLSIADINNDSDNDFDDSGIGEEEDSTGSASFQKALVEVAEAISPGGHITKRRARTRPVSLELLQSSVPDIFKAKSGARSAQAAVSFPSTSRYSGRRSSSSPEINSPMARPRRRVSGVSRASPRASPKVTHSQSQRLPSRAAFSRLPSAATLFFNPGLDHPSDISPVRPRTVSSNFAHSPVFNRPPLYSRHSYAGSAGSRAPSPLPFSFTQCRSPSPSPRSSPLNSGQTGYANEDDDDEEMFFNSNISNTSFIFNLTEGTPSTKKPPMLKKKFNPRDSGITLSDDEYLDILAGGSSESTDYLSAMPGASTSMGSIFSENDDPLVTPGVLPNSTSGWPDDIIVADHSDVGDQSIDSIFGLGQQGLMEDAFIRRTLAAGPRAPAEDAKKIPGTPVKKLKASHLGIARPWQSAVQDNKVGGVGFDTKMKKKKGKPRASLPAAFAPILGKGKQRFDDPILSDSEEETEDSPSGRNAKYTGVGLGRPSAPAKQAKSIMTRRGLTRRSSSSNFSSSSEASTPTRIKAQDWNLPPTVYTAFSPSNGALRFTSGHSASGSSSSSITAMNSPTINRAPNTIPLSPRASLPARIQSVIVEKEESGRMERDFVEVESVGSGHFGKVFRARLKNGTDGEVFAIKRSEQFEPGGKKRLRLREEVEILDHLRSAAAVTWPQGRHPNVLAYIDSWEQDCSLYIRTELCESGNFETFLGTYGRRFSALDEARVWKIIADLSNGLKFIHDAGVIHLDIKPANIFMTSEGHFKIGDFGMAALWPAPENIANNKVGLEREGDKRYLAPEILQNKYGPAADIFSFGMTMLETAVNIEVPADGPSWHRLREDDFSQVPFQAATSPELILLLREMMCRDVAKRITIHEVDNHPVVLRARQWMQRTFASALAVGASTFPASALASAPEDFLEEILDRRSIDDDDDDGAMDLSA